MSVINAFWRRRGTELPLFHLIRPGPLCLSVCLSLSLSVSLSLSPSLSPPPSLSQPRWPSNYGVRLESGKPEFDSCFPRGDSLSVCLSVSLSLSLSLSLPPPPPPPPHLLSHSLVGLAITASASRVANFDSCFPRGDCFPGRVTPVT